MGRFGDLPMAEDLHRLAGQAEAAPGGGTLDVVAPWSGEVAGRVPAAGPPALESALERGHRAQSAWARRPAAERAAVLLRFHDLVLRRRDWLLDVIQTETGKARLHAFEEVMDVALTARHYAVRAPGYLRPRRRRGAVPLLTTALELRHPLGVVGLIAPWNYPFSLAVSDAVPALLAGNAVVLKPAEQTPFSALAGRLLLREAGLPEDLFQVVAGDGAALGPVLVDGVDYVAFTGSAAAGRRVAARAGEALIGCSLELGGKNPMLVLRDADLGRAVDGAVRGCFTNAGQLCIHAERLYVQRPVLEAFLERFIRQTAALRLGAGFNWDVEMGSLASAAQLTKVEAHVADARRQGAEVLCGGRARSDLGPWFYEPTVLGGVRPSMRVATEETFGPVVAVAPFDDPEEGVALANDSPYGLNASLWSRDLKRARRLGPRIRCGTVNINEAYAAAWGSFDAPMGGMNASGVGRRHGEEGFRKYTASQTVAVQRLAGLAPPPAVGPRRFADLLTRAARWMARVPGLR